MNGLFSRKSTNGIAQFCEYRCTRCALTGSLGAHSQVRTHRQFVCAFDPRSPPRRCVRRAQRLLVDYGLMTVLKYSCTDGE